MLPRHTKLLSFKISPTYSTQMQTTQPLLRFLTTTSDRAQPATSPFQLSAARQLTQQRTVSLTATKWYLPRRVQFIPACHSIKFTMSSVRLPIHSAFQRLLAVQQFRSVVEAERIQSVSSDSKRS